MLELIIFDLDGTLVDSKKDIATSVNLTLGELGFPARDPEQIYGLIGGGVHKLILGSLPEGRSDMLDKGVDLFWAAYKEHVLDTTKLYTGVYKMLETLSTIRRMAIATNKPYAHTHMIIQGLDIDRYFASVQGWKMGIPVKPEIEDKDNVFRLMEGLNKAVHADRNGYQDGSGQTIMPPSALQGMV